MALPEATFEEKQGDMSVKRLCASARSHHQP
jgi:hypothetical protein